MKLENLVQELDNDKDIKWLKSLYKEKTNKELNITTIEIEGNEKKLIIDLVNDIITLRTWKQRSCSIFDEFNDSKVNISNRDFEKIKCKIILAVGVLLGNTKAIELVY